MTIYGVKLPDWVKPEMLSEQDLQFMRTERAIPRWIRQNS